MVYRIEQLETTPTTVLDATGTSVTLPNDFTRDQRQQHQYAEAEFQRYRSLQLHDQDGRSNGDSDRHGRRQCGERRAGAVEHRGGYTP